MFNIRACDSFSLFAPPATEPNAKAPIFFPMTFNHIVKMKLGEFISEMSLTVMKKLLCCICPSLLEEQRWGGSLKRQIFPSFWPYSAVSIFSWIQEANNLTFGMFSQIWASFLHTPLGNSRCIFYLTLSFWFAWQVAYSFAFTHFFCLTKNPILIPWICPWFCH